MLEERLVVLRLDAGEGLYEELVLEVEEAEPRRRGRLGVEAWDRRVECERGGWCAARRLGGGGEQQRREQTDSG